mmetsp:Transcript_8642/g.28358  ORF Transcript_8642/g.28358 Transcript_8642/m.28358 type:complete len:536 (-) Transcript_8642:735-2342(-)
MMLSGGLLRAGVPGAARLSSASSNGRRPALATASPVSRSRGPSRRAGILAQGGCPFHAAAAEGDPAAEALDGTEAPPPVPEEGFEIESLDDMQQLKYVSYLGIYGIEEATLRWAQELGPVFRIDNSKVKQKSLVFLTDPVLIEHVCRYAAASYSERFLPDVYPYAMKDKGFVSSQGEYNKKHRQMASPTFTLSSYQSEFMQSTAAKTKQLLDVWRVQPGGGVVEIDAANQMQRLALDIIGDVAFTYDFGGIAAIELELAGGRAAENDQLLELINVSMEEIGRMAVPFITKPMLETASRWGVPNVRRMEAAMEGMRVMCQPMIEDRRRRMLAGEACPRDLLGSLLQAQMDQVAAGGEGFTDFELWEDVHDVMGAGHETSANVMTCALWEVAMHPEVDAQVCEELQELGGSLPTFEDFKEGRLATTEAVIKETLRLYPPLPIFPRLCGEDNTLPTGHIVPEGDCVMMSAYAMGRLASLWPEPYAFRPSRFTDPAETEGRHPFAWVPFGAGPRMCLGSNFAMSSTAVMLATILQEYKM